MKKVFFSVFLMVAVFGNILAQGNYKPYGSSREKPEWAETMFTQDLDHSYIEAVMVRDDSQSKVRDEAKKVIAQRRQLATGEVLFNTKSEESDGIIVSSKLIGEYWEYDGAFFRGYFLFQTRKNRQYDFERVEFTDKYPFSPRVFVPGLAQIHKGSTVKGVCFIAGEIAFVGGVVIAESLRASYDVKIGTTHNAKDKQNYIDNADNMQNIRNVMIAGAAALYVWNVIDGIAAKGNKHVRIASNKLDILPYFTPQSGGVVLALKF